MKKLFRNVIQLLRGILLKAKTGVLFPLFLMFRTFFASPYRTAIVITIPFLFLLFLLDYHVFLSSKNFNWISVVAQTHGIFFDIFLLGLFLIIFEVLREKRRKIQKYREELEDIFFWNEKEGVFKKAGIIRRLSALGAKVSDLTGIVLTSANLNKVNLQNATLEGADLTGAKVNDARLDRVILSRSVTNKEEVILSVENQFTRITQAELNNTVMCDAECACIDFSGIQMMHAKLNRTNLRSAVFNGTILRFAEMKNANLEDADFTDADLYRVTFQDANLQGALFSKDKDKKWKNGYCALLNHTNFEHANLNGAVMNHVDMSHAFFKNASMINVKLVSASLGWVNLENTLLIDADLHEADLNNASLKDANLTGANLKGVKNLTFEQLKEVKTLYQASLDDELFKAITKNGCNHLLKWPEK
ncbi:MAG: pentapeptide repeat-containing protein [Spirochaetales bacterium]|nr:pentapeptide repeat-containing protein [Spirochaetales bacterium]